MFPPWELVHGGEGRGGYCTCTDLWSRHDNRGAAFPSAKENEAWKSVSVLEIGRSSSMERSIPGGRGLLTEGVNLSTVYIFLGTAMSLIDMMNSMQNQRLLDNGEYMVIHVDMMTYSPREAQKYLWSEYKLIHKATRFQNSTILIKSWYVTK